MLLRLPTSTTAPTTCDYDYCCDCYYYCRLEQPTPSVPRPTAQAGDFHLLPRAKPRAKFCHLYAAKLPKETPICNNPLRMDSCFVAFYEISSCVVPMALQGSVRSGLLLAQRTLQAECRRCKIRCLPERKLSTIAIQCPNIRRINQQSNTDVSSVAVGTATIMAATAFILRQRSRWFHSLVGRCGYMLSCRHESCLDTEADLQHVSSATLNFLPTTAAKV